MMFKPPITNPVEFAQDFNFQVPGAYRPMTVEDIRALTDHGLIKRYGYYSPDDMQTIISILNYEQWRLKHSSKLIKQLESSEPVCKLCGNSLPIPPEGKHGRHKEYCSDCERYRLKIRYKKHMKKKLSRMVTEHGLQNDLCTPNNFQLPDMTTDDELPQVTAS